MTNGNLIRMLLSNLRAITGVTFLLNPKHRKIPLCEGARLRLDSISLGFTKFFGGRTMRSKLMLCVVLGLASAAYAKEPKAYQTGKLLQMHSVQCGVAEKDAKRFTGEMLGTGSRSKTERQLLCQR